MPPIIENIHGNEVWNALFQEWKNLNAVLVGINDVNNYAGIIAVLKNLGLSHTKFVEIEKPHRLKLEITKLNLTSHQVENLSDEDQTELCKLRLCDILDVLQKLAPLNVTTNIAKCVPYLIETIAKYMVKPEMRHRVYLFDTDIALPHLQSINSILTYIDNLSGSTPNNTQKFAVQAVDAILHDRRLHQDPNLAHDGLERQRAEKIKKFDVGKLRDFAEKATRPECLYERAFIDWAELLIQQASFYFIKYPLEDSFHDRHSVVNKILQETVKNIHQNELSTIHRMIHMAQFILQANIGNRSLFKLLIPALQKVPTLEKFHFNLYANDEKGRALLVDKLEEFKNSEAYKGFEQGYEQHHAFVDVPIPPKTDEPKHQRVKKPHQPLLPITPAEIKLRLQHLPMEIIQNAPEKPSASGLRKFLNWLRGILTIGKLRMDRIQEVKRRDPSIIVTENGFVKSPPHKV